MYNGHLSWVRENIILIVLRVCLSSVPVPCCRRLLLALGEAIMLKVAGREERSYRVMASSQGSLSGLMSLPSVTSVSGGWCPTDLGASL